jgi:maltose alpha-D-glucosyltransferase/alpha-amylase
MNGMLMSMPGSPIVYYGDEIGMGGKTTFLKPANHRVLAYRRTLGKERVLCVHNRSRSAQAVELDLQSLAGALPIEMFGRGLFPRIGELPYMLTLGPYWFFWFKLRRF